MNPTPATVASQDPLGSTVAAPIDLASGDPRRSHRPALTRGQRDQRAFLLQRAQPAMTGLIDGSLSTLAPIFAVAFATHQPRDAFLAGLATASVPASAWPSPRDYPTPAT